MKNDCSSFLFNSTIASSAISTVFELGLFEQFTNDSISLSAFCKAKNLDTKAFTSLIYAMNCFDIVRLEDDLIKKGENFNEIDQNKGYFHWMIKGYGDFLVNSPKLLEQNHRQGQFYKRDGAAIARSGKDYGAKFVDQLVHSLLSSLPFKKIADLGCGSANRILEIVRKNKCKAIGVEIDTGGVGVARDNVQRAGYSDSDIQIVQADVSKLAYRKEFEDVDLISSFFMGHDLWPRERCIEIFRNFLKVFPNIQYFLFCDTFRSNLPPQKNVPTFTLGFEVFHALMEQYIPTLDEWRDLFGEAGWRCEKEISTEIPFTHVFLLKPI